MRQNVEFIFPVVSGFGVETQLALLVEKERRKDVDTSAIVI